MPSVEICLFGTVPDSIVDGPGLRFAVFVQGCPHACPGCHNQSSQPFEGGNVVQIDALVEEITANKLIKGVTLSGGEPLAQSRSSLELAKRLKGLGHDLWLYTGYLFESIMAGNEGSQAQELVALCDVVVDGPFIKDLQSYQLSWRGSSNQRIIDVSKSLEAGKVVLWEHEENHSMSGPPSSW